MERNTLKHIYAIEFSFTQTIIGEALGTSEEEIRQGLTLEFGDAPDFKIIRVEDQGEDPQTELPLEVIH